MSMAPNLNPPPPKKKKIYLCQKYTQLFRVKVHIRYLIWVCSFKMKGIAVEKYGSKEETYLYTSDRKCEVKSSRTDFNNSWHVVIRNFFEVSSCNMSWGILYKKKTINQ